LFQFPIEQLDLTPDERAAINRARAAATEAEIIDPASASACPSAGLSGPN
jgi:hypothetical protein